jgi:L-amino acid N-acyltransferase YncA
VYAVPVAGAEATTVPVYAAAAAPVADRKRRHGWPVWVATGAIALLIFAAGAHVGFALGARFATRGVRAGVVRAQVQQRGAVQGRGFGRGFRR